MHLKYHTFNITTVFCELSEYLRVCRCVCVPVCAIFCITFKAFSSALVYFLFALISFNVVTMVTVFCSHQSERMDKVFRAEQYNPSCLMNWQQGLDITSCKDVQVFGIWAMAVIFLCIVNFLCPFLISSCGQACEYEVIFVIRL